MSRGKSRNKALRRKRGDLDVREWPKLKAQPFACCGKKQYATEAAASHALFWYESFSDPGRRVPVRVYQCERGWWHVTGRKVWSDPPPPPGP